MKKVFQTILVSLVLIACSKPLDATKVKKQKLSLALFEIPIELSVPEASKALKGADPEDMLGMFSIFSAKVKGENFAIEATCTTMGGMSLEEVLEEKGGELKTESGFNKIIEEHSDGFLFERKEINGDLNYAFFKAFVTDNEYVIITPEPKSDGNTALEEAKYMYDILNAK